MASSSHEPDRAPVGPAHSLDRLDAKRVLVVGASGHGTGAAVAAQAQRRGADVILAARSGRGLDAAEQLLSTPVQRIELDMTDADAVQAAVSALGELDHVAVTADPGQPGPFLEQPLAGAHEKFGKFWGAFHVARAAAPQLRKGGSLVFTSSIAAEAPAQRGAVLSAVNAAINGLTIALARELAPVRVNAVAPSYMGSESLPPAALRDAERWAQETLPVARLTWPEETAAAIVFLMTQPTMTGVILPLDGGLRLAR